MHLLLYPDRNEAEIDGRRVAGRHQWEVALLHLLVSASASPAGCLQANTLDTALHAAAGKTPLCRRQRSRLLNGIARMFVQAGAETALAQRLVIAPRHATVGPWTWHGQADDSVSTVPMPWPARPRDAATQRLPSFAMSGVLGESARLCQAMLVAQALMHEGELHAAASLLANDADWTGASPELQAWRWARRAEALWKQREPAAADQAIAQAEHWVAQHPLAARLHGGLVALLRPRMAYALDPVGRAEEALLLLQAVAPEGLQPDRVAAGLTFNQLALCRRRLGEQAQRDGDPEGARQMLQAAVQGHLAAALCFASAEHAPLAQSAVANLAHLLGLQLGLPLDEAKAVRMHDVLEWHALSQAWHYRFNLPEASVWESIFLGDLWLHRRGGREAFRTLVKQPDWEGLMPDNLDFYRNAAHRARQLGDPRQLAHALLNLGSFARRTRLPDAASAAEQELHAVLDRHAELAGLMQAEGYRLPRRLPTPGSWQDVVR